MPAPKSKSLLKKQVGERIRKARLARGIQQQSLAKAAGVRPHTMWRYEIGEMMPGADKVTRIADALGVPVTWLMRGGLNPPGLALDSEAPPPRATNDPRLVHEQQLQMLDEIDASPDVRSAWTIHMHGTGAHQRVTRVYVSRFIEVAQQELVNGANVEQAADTAGTYALNAALEAHAARRQQLRPPDRKR